MKIQHNTFSRRKLLGYVSTLGTVWVCYPTVSSGQADHYLPLDTPGLDHLDVIVPDVEATARFYMQLFKTHLHAQPFRGGQRYFVLLGTLPESRQVPYLAVGASNGRGSYIGHFCTSVFGYREQREAINMALGEAFAAAGFGTLEGGGGFGGIFLDPDGIEYQLLPAPDTLIGAATPSDLVEPDQGLLTPKNLDHILLKVSDLDAAAEYYSIMYGPDRLVRESDSRLHFDFGNSRLILEQSDYRYGDTIGIAHACIKVENLDKDATEELLLSLGADIEEANTEGAVRFRDIDGNRLELVSA